MLRAIGQSLRIDVAAQAVAVRRISRWRGDSATELAAQAIAPSADHPFDAIANALRVLLGELEVEGWPVSFTLADELTRMWRLLTTAELRHTPRVSAFFDFIVSEIDTLRPILTG